MIRPLVLKNLRIEGIKTFRLCEIADRSLFGYHLDDSKIVFSFLFLPNWTFKRYFPSIQSDLLVWLQYVVFKKPEIPIEYQIDMDVKGKKSGKRGWFLYNGSYVFWMLLDNNEVQYRSIFSTLFPLEEYLRYLFNKTKWSDNGAILED